MGERRDKLNWHWVFTGSLEVGCPLYRFAVGAAWGLPGVHVSMQERILPLAETCEGRSGPVCMSRVGEALAGMPRRKAQWPEVPQKRAC